MSITMDDDPTRTCAEALSKADADHASDEAIYVIRIACGARGRYDWAQSGFGRISVVQPGTWLAERGVTTVPRAIDLWSDCEAITVGKPSREALLCKGPPEVPDGVRPERFGGQSIFRLTVVYADQKVARIALDVPYAAGPEDNEFGSYRQNYEPDSGKYISLVQTLASDGMSLTLGERPRATCAKRLADAQARNESEGIKGVTAAIHAMKIACSSRGRYEWRGGKFVRGQ
jgi:hypothetical protein